MDENKVYNYYSKETVKTVSNRVYGFSYLRATACIAIIILHFMYSIVLMFGTTITNTEYIVSMVVVNCMMWAVPCFIMVTGALLLDPGKNITYRKLFGRYILRVFAALVFFGIVFRLFDIYMDKEQFGICSFMQGFYEIFTGTGWSHLWYLYLLIGLYLLLPFYKKIVCLSTGNELKYLLCVYIIFLSLFPLLQIGNIYSGFYIHVSTIYPFYLFLGYVLYKGVLKPGIFLSTGMTLIGTVCIAIFTYVRWNGDLAQLEQLWSYSSIFVIIQAAGIFCLFKDLSNKKVYVLKVFLEKLDQCSFGIYLIHMMFVRIIVRYMQFNPFEEGGIIYVAGVIILVLLLSWMVILVLKKIPLMKKIV